MVSLHLTRPTRPGRILVSLATVLGLLSGAPAGAAPLDTAVDWLYVLQPEGAADLDAIAASGFGVVVMDYASDGSAATEFTPADLDTLHAAGMVALAYLSIGEAESYRYYFDPAWIDQTYPDPDAPAWLGPTNPNWAGNYKVRYWDPDWHAVLYGTLAGPDTSYLDRIIDQGFDGVYLDIVDAFYYWSVEASPTERSRAQARQEMVDLIQALADHARVTRGVSDFLIVPQNGEDIVRDDQYELDALGTSYLGTVSGLGIEDLFYDEFAAQPALDTSERLGVLGDYLDAGRPVLVVDYVWDPGNPLGAANVARVDDFAQRSLDQGLIPYVAVVDRALDEVLPVPLGPYAVPQPRTTLFSDGFETGDTTRWSARVP